MLLDLSQDSPSEMAFRAITGGVFLWESYSGWKCCNHVALQPVPQQTHMENRTYFNFFLINIVTAVSAPSCEVERSAGSLTRNNNSETFCLVSSAVCFLLAMSSGTIAPVGLWSSGSMHVHYVQKTGGGHDFYFSNSEMNIKTETPRFDVIQLYILAYIVFYKNRMTFR